MLIASEDQVYSATPIANGAVAPELRLEGETVRAMQEGRGLSAICLQGGDVAVLENGHTRRLQSGIEGSVESLDILSEDPVELLIGAEPPHLYRLADGDGPARVVEGFDALECRDEWVTPWGGPPAVRSVVHSGDWVYADIHVGSIMRSADRGVSWEPVTPDLHRDVHQVAVSPASPQRLYANTADAVFVSHDRGQTWTHRSEGLPVKYGRAVAVHPRDADCVLATVSRGPHQDVDGQLYRSDDGGRNWSHVTDGFPAATSGNIDTFHLAFSDDGAAWAAVAQNLYRSDDRGEHWEVAWTAPAAIAMISCAGA